MAAKKYKLVVIGAGSGLDVAVMCARNYGWDVAVIEKGPMGGTCLNRGCIPSKILLHAANIVEEIKSADKFGIKAKIEEIDFAAVTNRANSHVDQEAARIEQNLLNQEKVHLFKGAAKFKDPHTLTVNGEDVIGEKILIAAGARPMIPKINGLDKVDYWTSTEALRQTKRPKSLIIIGGGYISAELGHFYSAMGTQVTILHRGDLLINREDRDIARKFTEIFSRKNTILFNYETTSVTNKDYGSISVAVKDPEGKEMSLSAEKLLVATGLQPNTDLLNLENADVKLNERGFIETDDYMRTSSEHIFALGDIVGKAPFKHGANYEAQHVFWNIKDTPRRMVNYSIMPHAIFSSPQIAGVGLTEEQAIEQGLSFQVRRWDYARTGMGKALEEKDGFVKFIIDPSKDQILGCHILGPDASVLIHEVVVAMTASGGDINTIKNTIHIHPALNEVVQRAL